MRETILCVSDAEPASFHPAGRRGFSVRLSFRAGDDADEEQACAAYAAFLRRLEHVRFAAYALRGLQLTVLDAPEVCAAPYSADDSKRFIAWLKRRAAIHQSEAARAQANQVRFFAGDAGAAGSLRGASAMGAEQVILAAASWIAPVPQELHLAFVLRVGGDDAAEHMVFLPYFDADMPRDSYTLNAAPIAGRQLRLEDYAGTVGSACESTLTRQPLLNGARQSTLIDENSGFAEAGNGSELSSRMLSRFEQRSASLLSGFFAVREQAGALRWPLDDHGACFSGNPAAVEVRAARLLVWGAVSALATSLDTILIALLMPGRAARDGALLAPFLDQLLGRLQRDLPGLLPPGSARSDVRSMLRAQIGGLFAGVPPDAAARRLWSGRLLQVCGLSVPSDAGDWLRVLLDAYIADDDAGYGSVVARARAAALGQTGGEVWRAPAGLLDQRLAPLRELVTGEEGIEASVERLLALPAVRDGFIAACAASAPVTPGTLVTIYQAALDAYSGRLRDGLNGADAAHASAGSLLADLLLLDTDERLLRGTPAQLTAAFEHGLFWHRRLGMDLEHGVPLPGQAQMSMLIAPLPKPYIDFSHVLDTGDAAQDAALGLFDIAARMQASARTDLFPPDTARFLPDHAPQALAVRMTIDPAADDNDIDDFATVFAGVALLVRRSAFDGKPGRWAYANLAEVLFHEGEGEGEGGAGVAPLTIQSIPTTLVDGRRALFVAYDGLPIATSAFDTSLSNPAAMAWEKLISTDYPESHAGYAALAPLAYGARFDVAAHAVGRAGTLPLALQAAPAAPDGARPWVPEAGIDFVEVDAVNSKRFVTSYDYARRTAIGRTALIPLREAGEVLPEGLKPLAGDYPRLGLSNLHGQFLDVFRNSDGSGAIALPRLPDETVTVVLRDLWCWNGDDGKVQLCASIIAEGDIGIDPPAQFMFSLPAGDAGALTLSITRDTAPDTGAPASCLVKLDLGAPPAGSLWCTFRDDTAWLRLRLHKDSGGAALSLADPGADTPGAAAASRPAPDNLVLIGENPDPLSPVWQAQFSRPLVARLDFPRVGYLDFARWVANPALRLRLFGDMAMAERDDFLALLLAAYIGRTDDAELARLLERLPDPAVSAIRLELLATDGLRDAPARMMADGLLAPFVGEIPSRPLAELLNGDWFSKALANRQIKLILHELDMQLRRELHIVSDGDKLKWLASGKGIKVLLPPGVVACLSARPVVEMKLFNESRNGNPSVIDKRLLQWATGFDADGQYATFQGASIQIEAMTGPMLSTRQKPWRLSRAMWAQQVGQCVRHQPAGMAREYRLLAGPESDAWQWRQLGAIDVATQRWRFSGRPIYTWIDPKACAYTVATPGQASIHIDPGHEKYAAFEAEAFFGRQPYDAEMENTPLLPLPAATELAVVRWEQAAATLFRHRFTLRSRYGAAMLQTRDGLCEAWPEDVPDNGVHAWLRVVMLADRSHLTLTRPQLRALLPATISPDEGGTATPPLIALLQEHPYCNGGLAARIAAEIRTGVGFELTDQLRPLDARKELGPDARLSYQAMPALEAHHTVLAAEGPIGLTFDDGVAADAAFPNTALMLAPRRLRYDDAGAIRQEGAALDEHFMSVVLRRYLDHRWLVEEADARPPVSAGPGRASFNATWWIEFPHADGELVLVPAGERRGLVVARCVADGIDLKVTVDRFAIDATVDTNINGGGAPSAPSHDSNALCLCTVPGLFTGGSGTVAFLHTPVDPRRAVLSVFYLTAGDSGEQSGSGNAPVLLGSLEWTVPPPFDATAIGIGGTDPMRAAINASQSTALQWARTNTNFDTVYADSSDAQAGGGPVAVAELRLRGDTVEGRARLRFQRDERAADSAGWWIRARQSTQPFPVHTQRHIAILPSRLRTGIGRPIDVPMPLRMAPARQILLPGAQLPDRVRIVEFETPAIIMAYTAPGAPAAPEHYRIGYLDLMACGFDRIDRGLAPHGWQLSLHLRIIGGGHALATLRSIRLDLCAQASEQQWVSLRLDRAVAGERKAFAFVVDLALDQYGIAQGFSCGSIDDDGTLQAPRQSSLLAKNEQSTLARWQVVAAVSEGGGTPPPSQGIELRIGEAVFENGDQPDVWLEVSMLASVAEGGNSRSGFMDGVDCDWFFGGAAVGAEAAVTVAELARMREAQARIISVSPPMEVAAGATDPGV